MGVQINQINIIDKIVPGSFELPIIAKYLAGKYYIIGYNYILNKLKRI